MAPAAVDPPSIVDLGPVQLRLSRSPTASLFHAVDQMSGWSEYCHPQYAKWAPSPDDLEAVSLLRRHAVLRESFSWGEGLERAFYIGEEAGIPGAALSEERAILTGMRPRLDAKLGTSEAQTAKLEEALRHEAHRFARMLSAWLRIVAPPRPPEPIPVVLVPSPGSGAGGGGANGGVVVVEVPEGDVFATLTTVAHELVHAVAAPHEERMAQAASKCGHGLDGTDVGEAFAYAIAPGRFAYGSSIKELERQAQSPSESYRRFARLAIAIEPAMNAAFSTPTPHAFDDLLDAVCTAAKLRAQP